MEVEEKDGRNDLKRIHSNVSVSMGEAFRRWGCCTDRKAPVCAATTGGKVVADDVVVAEDVVAADGVVAEVAVVENKSFGD